MKAVADAYGYAFGHDEPHSEEEVQLLSGFLQEIQDWGELSSNLEAGDRVKAAYRISELLRQLEEAGFWVFGGREVRKLEGGIGSPSDFPVAILKVMRAKSPEIMKVDLRSDPEQGAPT